MENEKFKKQKGKIEKIYKNDESGVYKFNNIYLAWKSFFDTILDNVPNVIKTEAIQNFNEKVFFVSNSVNHYEKRLHSVQSQIIFGVKLVTNREESNCLPIAFDDREGT
jgi:hypothetical protein